jgi:hypothetical protein
MGQGIYCDIPIGVTVYSSLLEALGGFPELLYNDNKCTRVMKRDHIGRSKQTKAHQRAMPHSPHMNVKIFIFEDIVLMMEKTRNQYERRGSVVLGVSTDVSFSWMSIQIPRHRSMPVVMDTLASRSPLGALRI